MEWFTDNIPQEILGALLTASFVYMAFTIRENRAKKKWFQRKVRELIEELNKNRDCVSRLRKIRSKYSDYLSLSDAKEALLNQYSIIRFQQYIDSWLVQIHDLVEPTELERFKEIDKKLLTLVSDLDQPISECQYLLGRFQVNSVKKLLDAYIVDTRDSTREFLVELSDIMPEIGGLGDLFETSLILPAFDETISGLEAFIEGGN